MDKKNSSLTPDNPSTRLIGMDALCRNSIELILYTRKIAARQINLIQLMTYYALGRWIVEEQQAAAVSLLPPYHTIIFMFFKYIFMKFIIFLMLIIKSSHSHLLRPSVRYLPGGIPILFLKTLEK